MRKTAILKTRLFCLVKEEPSETACEVLKKDSPSPQVFKRIWYYDDNDDNLHCTAIFRYISQFKVVQDMKL